MPDLTRSFHPIAARAPEWADADHDDARLPSGWWLIVAALAYALVYVLATWAVLA
ncbi:hypothetical protein [Cereibacter johrii]|uniref:hypothetical protein n=1 Tax=Cereibacter johrii TaxID=445629 RepID=UPI003CF644E0